MNAKVLLGSRLVLGSIFFIFGLNGLVMILTGAGFIPMPPPKPEMASVMGGLFGAIYLMPLVKILEVLSGLMLLTNRYINLSLTLLGPIVVNILGIHLFLDLSGLPMTAVVVITYLIILKSRWSDFKVLLKA